MIQNRRPIKEPSLIPRSYWITLAIASVILVGLALLFSSCGATKTLSRYDPTLNEGCANARTDTYAYYILKPHAYKPQFYANIYAQLSTLRSEAVANPLNDSAMILTVDLAVKDIQTIEGIDSTGGGSAGYYQIMALELNQVFDTGIQDQKIRKDLPQ